MNHFKFYAGEGGRVVEGNSIRATVRMNRVVKNTRGGTARRPHVLQFCSHRPDVAGNTGDGSRGVRSCLESGRNHRITLKNL